MLDFNLHLWIHRQTVFTDSGFQKCFWTRMIFTTELFLFLNISQKIFSVQRTVMTNGSAQGGKMQMLTTIVLWQFSSFMHIFPPILHGQVNVTLPAHNVWCSCNLQIKLQRKYAVIFFFWSWLTFDYICICRVIKICMFCISVCRCWTKTVIHR